jgi:hypothetical protein
LLFIARSNQNGFGISPTKSTPNTAQSNRV